MPDALLHAGCRDRSGISPPREVPHPLPHRRTQGPLEDGLRRLQHVDNRTDATRLERLGGLRSHAPQRADRPWREECRGVCFGDDQKAVGFAQGGGHLRDMLRCGGTHAAGQAGLVAHAGAKHPCDRSGRSPQAPRTAHVEKGLVDRQRFDQRCDLVEHAHDLARERHVSIEVRGHDDRLRAQAQRLPDRHGSSNTERASLVGSTGHDRPALGCADDDRLSCKGRVIEHLDSRVERIHVDVQDVGAGVVSIVGRHEAIPAVPSSHASILARPTDSVLSAFP